MPSIRVLLPAIEEAAQLARSYYRHHDRLGTQMKPDQTIVTVADRAVEALLRQAIAQHFPGCNVIGEEDKPDYDPSRSYTFIIDPIDGTVSFVNDTPSWAICLGVLDGRGTGRRHHLCPGLGQFLPCRLRSGQSGPAERSALTSADSRRRPSTPRQTLLVDSKLFRTHYMHDFPGRCRGFGSHCSAYLPGGPTTGLCHGPCR